MKVFHRCRAPEAGPFIETQAFTITSPTDSSLGYHLTSPRRCACTYPNCARILCHIVQTICARVSWKDLRCGLSTFSESIDVTQHMSGLSCMSCLKALLLCPLSRQAKRYLLKFVSTSRPPPRRQSSGSHNPKRVIIPRRCFLFWESPQAK